MTFRFFGRPGSKANRFAFGSLATPALLLCCQGPAEAVLNYYIFQDGGTLKIETRGALNLAGLPSQTGSICTLTPPPGGYLDPVAGLICSGVEFTNSDPYRKYVITPNGGFSAGNSFVHASSTSGVRNWLWGTETPNSSFYIIDPYTNGAPINSSATFNGKTLADVDLATTTGTIGTWTFFGDNNPFNTINVIVGNPPSTPAPGPLPLLGAGAAFAWSRRLRRRLGSAGPR